MEEIQCISLSGELVSVPKNQLAFRISVYGVTIWNDSVLLLKGHTSGHLWFPGGGVQPGERMEDTLSREYLEETGVTINVLDFLCIREEFFYHNVWKKPFHSLRLYYLCKPITTDLVADNEVDDGESEQPRWIRIDALSASDFDQPYGYEVLLSGMNRLALNAENV
jgi:8-oxo-dGTP diphosphatase